MVNKGFLPDKYALILSNSTHDFKRFMKPLQRKVVLIYILHPNSMDLIHCFLQRFMKHKTIMMPNNINKSISSSELFNWKIDHALNRKMLLCFSSNIQAWLPVTLITQFCNRKLLIKIDRSHYNYILMGYDIKIMDSF